jgi:hypothetical protein
MPKSINPLAVVAGFVVVVVAVEVGGGDCFPEAAPAVDDVVLAALPVIVEARLARSAFAARLAMSFSWADANSAHCNWANMYHSFSPRANSSFSFEAVSSNPSTLNKNFSSSLF